MLFAGAAALLVSCDSGDIYPEEQGYEEGITVEGNFTVLSPEAFPTDYTFIFGVFGANGNSPLASVNVVSLPSDGEKLNVKLDNIPDESTSAKLCLVNTGRQVVYTFFEYGIDGDGPANIMLPSAQIDLLKYDRIQKLVFEQYNCVSCHGSGSGAGNLLLTEGNSYSQLVNRSSENSVKQRVTAGDPDESFLLDALADETLLTPPHTGYITREGDISLLRLWIKAGCPNN